MGAVFSQLNQGENVTSGLKKVKKGEGLADRPIPVPKAKAAPKAAPAAPVAAKPPVFALAGKKWQVENQVGNKTMEITEGEVKHSIYVYKCTDCVLQVKTKVNNIVLDSCKKVMLVFDTVVAGIEIINCNSCKMQVTGKVATVSIEKCDGTQLILNRDSVDAEIVSAKSSELNIIVPGKTDEDEYVEHAIPEQFISKFDKDTGKWDTVCMAHTA